MTQQRQQFGFTMVEILVVIGIMVLLMAMTVPAVSVLQKSNKEIAARNLIRSQLWLAQAHAAAAQKYAGLRFQFDRDGVFEGRQYIVLIEKAGPGSATHEYNAVADTRPVAIPRGVGVISLDITSILNPNFYLDDVAVADGNPDMESLPGAMTFTIIFSPTGQMVIKNVLVKNATVSEKTFNTPFRVDLPKDNPDIALLYADGWYGNYDLDYPGTPLQKPWLYKAEFSTTGFFVTEIEGLRDADPGLRFDQYVGSLKPELINTYTGQLIDEEFN